MYICIYAYMDVYSTWTPASSQMAAYCAARTAGSSTYVTFCKWSRSGMERQPWHSSAAGRHLEFFFLWH